MTNVFTIPKEIYEAEEFIYHTTVDYSLENVERYDLSYQQQPLTEIVLDPQLNAHLSPSIKSFLMQLRTAGAYGVLRPDTGLLHIKLGSVYVVYNRKVNSISVRVLYTDTRINFI